MRIFSLAHSFAAPWDVTTAATWCKYPNEHSPHVVGVDVLRREVEGSVLRTERLLTCKQPIPGWVRMLAGGLDTSYVREVLEVDLAAQTLTLRLTNLTMNQLLRVEETVVYRPDPADGQATLFEQTAEITAFAGLQRVSRQIEEWSVERFGQNAVLGRRGLEAVLDAVKAKLP